MGESIVAFPTQLSSHVGVGGKLRNFYYQSNVQAHKSSLCESYDLNNHNQSLNLSNAVFN